MPFLRAAFNEHVEEARRAPSPYYEFDALWKAFNVYYASLHKPGDKSNVREIELIHRAVHSVPASVYPQLLSQTLTHRLERIDPILDGRAWVRFHQRMTGRHHKAVLAIEQVQAGTPVNREHVESMADLMYVVRCNMAHGMKSRYNDRDTEVFEATLPVLRALVKNLPTEEQHSFGVA
jgi:hypothetical protein